MEAAKPQLCTEDKKGPAEVSEEDEQGGVVVLDGPLDLLLIKRKVLARVYAQVGSRKHELTGLVSPKEFPDWATYRSDVQAMCQPVLDREPPSTASGSFYREAQRLLEFAKSAMDVVGQRQENERILLGKQARYARRMKRNQLAAMQGEWRQQPFELRDYEPLREYVPAEGLTEEQGEGVIGELETELEGLLSYTYSYEEKTHTADRERHWTELVASGVTEEEVIEAEVAAVMEDLTERVAWHNCPQEPAVREGALQPGHHVEEIPVWGMDSYTRRNVELALEDLENPMPPEQM
jgi:hypothetical protein